MNYIEINAIININFSKISNVNTTTVYYYLKIILKVLYKFIVRIINTLDFKVIISNNRG